MAIKSFVTGIGFYNSRDVRDLPGVQTDVDVVSRLFADLGFNAAGILRDSQCSKQPLLQGLTNFVDSGQAGDYLLWYHSGHGSNRYNPSENDKLSEILVTYEIDWNDPLYDTDLKKILLRAKPNVKMLVILDACHSEGLGDDKEVETPWSPSKFAPPPPDIAALNDIIAAAAIGTANEPTGPIELPTGNKDYTPAFVEAAESFPSYAQLTSARYNQKARMDFFSLDGIGVNMSVFTFYFQQEVRKNPSIPLGTLAWTVSRFSQEKGHVATLRAKPEYLESSFGNLEPVNKDVTDPNKVFLVIPPHLATESAVSAYINAVARSGINIIPAEDVRGSFADFLDVTRALVIDETPIGIRSRVVQRNGRVIDEAVIKPRK